MHTPVLPVDWTLLAVLMFPAPQGKGLDHCHAPGHRCLNCPLELLAFFFPQCTSNELDFEVRVDESRSRC